MDDLQPGQVISPRVSDDPQPANGAPAPSPRPDDEPGPTPGPEPAPSPGPTPEPSTIGVTSWSQAVPASEPAAWGYHQESPLPVQALPSNGISWTASEFIAHEKSAGWYLAVSLVGLLLAALDYFLTKDVVAVGAIVLTVLIFSTYAARKPRTQEYVLDQHGVHIGVKSYEFRSFKNFSVVHEGAIAGINFMPLKRFMPPLTIYVAPDMEDQVMSFLGGILPFEQKGSDSIDSLLRRIRF